MSLLFRTVRSPSLQLARSLSQRQVLDPSYVMPDGRVLSIQRAEESDLNLLFKFFKENFSVQEPLSRYLGIKYEDFGILFYGPVFKRALECGLSTMAFDGDELVAVSTITVNDVIREKVDFGKTEFGKEFDENMKKFGITRSTSYIYTLLIHAEEISAAILPENVKHIVRSEAGSVCPSHRGGDVRRKLAIETSKLAEAEGLEVMDAICSATASTKVMGDLGLVTKFPILYNSITDYGKQIIPTPLHDNNTSFNVMQGSIKEIARLQAPKPETCEKYERRKRAATA
ncbi:unnamed protein product [Bursaphelenchus xylophilus]|uniref:(pine wood nematode) hypothetical protein n=1 Tax=Bursaphelenchus xylophilus TaxID=6326 RepID=A0A1I7SAM1_BURXY|nr:unnamed protein product [Bursaphelenchus xylophilus]CAG9079187.1 unnamed protein product [Bursaphelenchus xylophilus]